MNKEQKITGIILEVANLFNEVTYSDLQGIAMAKANDILDLSIVQKGIKILPEWNTRLDTMTKGITDCSNKELYYLQEEISKELMGSNKTIKEWF